VFSCSSNVAEQSTESSDNGQHTVDYVDSMAEEYFFRSYHLYSGRGKKSRKDQDKNQKIIAKNSLIVDSQLILSLICIHILCENITKLGKYKFILVGFLSAALSSNHRHTISQSPTLPHTINQLGRWLITLINSAIQLLQFITRSSKSKS